MIDLTQVFAVDLSNVPAHILQGLQDGTMRLSQSNGNVYWAAGSGKTGIVDHLPFVQVDTASAQQVLSAAQAVQATVVATAVISTAVILGAIVLQTAYLSQRIQSVADEVKGLSREVQHQSLLTYIEKIAGYYGAVEAGRQLMAPPCEIDEVRDIAPAVLAELAIRRSDLHFYIRRLIDSATATADAKDSTISKAQYGLILNFMIEALEQMPAGIYVERELCTFVGKVKHSGSVQRQAGSAYRDLLKDFRQWAADGLKHASKGNPLYAEVFSQKDRVNALMDSDVNRLLLGIDEDKYWQQFADVKQAAKETSPLDEVVGRSAGQWGSTSA